MNRNFIDVSKHQKGIDLKKVIEENNYEFIMMRASISSKKYGDNLGKDIMFEEYNKICDELNVTKGFYHYSYGDQGEVESFLESIKGKVKTNTILAFDYEEETITNEYTTNFINEVKKIYPNNEIWIYANSNYIKNKQLEKLSDELKSNLWVANYGENTGEKNSDVTNIKNVISHQYTSVGKVNGYEGNLDLNVLLKDIDIEQDKPTENKPGTKGYAKEYAESGSCTFLSDAYIHALPELDKPLRPNVLYYKGETIKHYDRVIFNDGYIWVRYTRASTGEKAYVATGEYSSSTLKRTKTWCTFK